MISDLRQRIPVCPHGKPNNIDQYLLVSLERLESDLSTKLEYISGYRCPECNAKAGGVKNSAHLRGKAVDVKVTDSHLRCFLTKQSLMCGFRRIGIKKGSMHIDIDDELPQYVIWLYDTN